MFKVPQTRKCEFCGKIASCIPEFTYHGKWRCEACLDKWFKEYEEAQK